MPSARRGPRSRARPGQSWREQRAVPIAEEEESKDRRVKQPEPGD